MKKVNEININVILDSNLTEEFRKEIDELCIKYKNYGYHYNKNEEKEIDIIEVDDGAIVLGPPSFNGQMLNYVSKDKLFFVNKDLNVKKVKKINDLQVFYIDKLTSRIKLLDYQNENEYFKKYMKFFLDNNYPILISFLYNNNIGCSVLKCMEPEQQMTFFKQSLSYLNNIKMHSDYKNNHTQNVIRLVDRLIYDILQEKKFERTKELVETLKKFENNSTLRMLQTNIGKAIFRNDLNHIIGWDKFAERVENELSLNTKSKTMMEQVFATGVPTYCTNIAEIINYIKLLNEKVTLEQIDKIIDIYYDEFLVYIDITFNFNYINSINIELRSKDHLKLTDEEVQHIIYRQLKKAYEKCNRTLIDVNFLSGVRGWLYAKHKRCGYYDMIKEYKFDIIELIKSHKTEFPKLIKRISDNII